MDSPQMEESTKLKGGVQMAEEAKKADVKKGLATFLKVVLGLVFLGIGIWAILRWWKLLFLIIKGCIGLFFILAGVITLAIAKE
jgi:fatty acid desaturase